MECRNEYDYGYQLGVMCAQFRDLKPKRTLTPEQLNWLKKAREAGFNAASLMWASLDSGGVKQNPSKA